MYDNTTQAFLKYQQLQRMYTYERALMLLYALEKLEKQTSKPRFFQHRRLPILWDDTAFVRPSMFCVTFFGHTKRRSERELRFFFITTVESTGVILINGSVIGFHKRIIETRKAFQWCYAMSGLMDVNDLHYPIKVVCIFKIQSLEVNESLDLV